MTAQRTSSRVLVTYWRQLNRDDKQRLADELETTVGYLRQIFLYGRSPGGVMARQLADKTGISATQLRPDIFFSDTTAS